MHYWEGCKCGYIPAIRRTEWCNVTFNRINIVWDEHVWVCWVVIKSRIFAQCIRNVIFKNGFLRFVYKNSRMYISPFQAHMTKITKESEHTSILLTSASSMSCVCVVLRVNVFDFSTAICDFRHSDSRRASCWAVRQAIGLMFRVIICTVRLQRRITFDVLYLRDEQTLGLNRFSIGCRLSVWFGLSEKESKFNHISRGKVKQLMWIR